MNMKKQRYMSWDAYFMAIAKLSAFRSKDPKTQNGACIVDTKRKIIGIGYNGLPRGCIDDDPVYWMDTDDNDLLRSKHTYVVHAEKNAIYNCMAHDMTGASMYITQFPCNTCAQAIIQVGIQTVIYVNMKNHAHHKQMNRAVEKMLSDACVEIRAYSNKNESDRKFLEGLDTLREIYG